MSFLSLTRYKVASFAIGAALLAALVNQRLDRAGITRSVTPLNNDDCFSVPGLEACEDARWVDQESGLAYLVCSSREARVHWVPAILHLNATQLPTVSTDYIALFDLNTRSHKRLELRGLPAEANGIWVHGISLYRSPSSPSKLTIFLNSHRPPADRSLAPTQGADSVVEIFETEVGSDSAQYVKTVRHPLVRTPNSVVAVGDRQFYVSNDHRYKVHWTRKWETYKSVPSDIIYCDASGAGEPKCIVAADQVVYPNGIAGGDNGLLYQASTLEGLMRVWQIQPNHTLSRVEEIYINRHFDNAHVGANGDIFLTALTKIFEFREAGADAGMSGKTAAVEVFRVREQAKKSGKKYRSDLVFADTGEVVSASTSAAAYQNKLLLTGLYSKEVVVCTLK